MGASHWPSAFTGTLLDWLKTGPSHIRVKDFLRILWLSSRSARPLLAGLQMGSLECGQAGYERPGQELVATTETAARFRVRTEGGIACIWDGSLESTAPSHTLLVGKQECLRYLTLP